MHNKKNGKRKSGILYMHEEFLHSKFYAQRDINKIANHQGRMILPSTTSKLIAN